MKGLWISRPRNQQCSQLKMSTTSWALPSKSVWFFLLFKFILDISLFFPPESGPNTHFYFQAFRKPYDLVRHFKNCVHVCLDPSARMEVHNLWIKKTVRSLICLSILSIPSSVSVCRRRVSHSQLSAYISLLERRKEPTHCYGPPTCRPLVSQQQRSSQLPAGNNLNPKHTVSNSHDVEMCAGRSEDLC